MFVTVNSITRSAPLALPFNYEEPDTIGSMKTRRAIVCDLSNKTEAHVIEQLVPTLCRNMMFA